MPIVKYRDTVRSPVRKWLKQSSCLFDCDLGMAQGITIEMGVQIPMRKGNFGGRFAHCIVQGLFAVSCAETAAPIDLLFGLLTPVGRRKHEFNRIWQMAPMCRISMLFARWHQCTRRYSAISCAKTAEPINLPFGLWTWVGQRSTCSIIFAKWHQWRHLANTIESSVCGGDAALCQITLTTCYYYY